MADTEVFVMRHAADRLKARFMQDCEVLVKRLCLAHWEDNTSAAERLTAEVRGLKAKLRAEKPEPLHPLTLLISLLEYDIPEKVLNALEKHRITRVKHLIRCDAGDLYAIPWIGRHYAEKLLAVRVDLERRLSGRPPVADDLGYDSDLEEE